MNFLSSKELSEKWGIGQRRIILLAREGRIPGAKLYGKTWVFPEDAQKPPDGRTRQAKADLQAKPDNFRYPSFEYRDISSFSPPLSEEEKCLKTATELYYACRFSEAEKLLGDLPETATNRYIRIMALYLGCMFDMFLCNVKQFFDRYEKLHAELSDDFPHKNEMKELIHKIDALLGDDSYFANEFAIEPGYRYHESYIPHLSSLATIHLFPSENKPTVSEISNAELICSLMESSGAYADLVSIHIYLGCAYATIGKGAEADYHFTKALLLAEKYDILAFLAVQYTYTRKLFANALSGFSQGFRDKLNRVSAEIHIKFLHFSEQAHISSAYAMMHREYIYMQYAVQGLTNKEVAKLMHISVGTVGKHYGEIYALLGVKNKKEMKELYNSLTDKTANKKKQK